MQRKGRAVLQKAAVGKWYKESEAGGEPMRHCTCSGELPRIGQEYSLVEDGGSVALELQVHPHTGLGARSGWGQAGGGVQERASGDRYIGVDRQDKHAAQA